MQEQCISMALGSHLCDHVAVAVLNNSLWHDCPACLFSLSICLLALCFLRQPGVAGKAGTAAGRVRSERKFVAAKAAAYATMLRAKFPESPHMSVFSSFPSPCCISAGRNTSSVICLRFGNALACALVFLVVLCFLWNSDKPAQWERIDFDFIYLQYKWVFLNRGYKYCK